MGTTFFTLNGSAAFLPVELIDMAFERLVILERVISVDIALNVAEETFSVLLGVDTDTVGAAHTVKTAQRELALLGVRVSPV